MRTASSYCLSVGCVSSCNWRSLSCLLVQMGEAGRRQDAALRRHFAIRHRKPSVDTVQGEAIMLRESPAVFHRGGHIFCQHAADMFERGPIGVASALLRCSQQGQDFPYGRLLADDVQANLDALIADVNGRAGNQLAHGVLALAAEGAIERLSWSRTLCRGRRKGALIARLRFSGIDLGGQDIPILIGERLGDQLQRSLWGVSTALSCKASRRARAMVLASRKSRM